jgi:membrane protein implicated in regulation of membrane protease activity
VPHEYRQLVENLDTLPRAAWWWFGAMLAMSALAVAWALTAGRHARKPKKSVDRKTDRPKKRVGRKRHRGG